MVGPFATLLAALALVAPSPQPRMLVAGPAFAGIRVVWGEQQERLSILRAWPDASLLWEDGSSWFAGPLAGSATLVAGGERFELRPGMMARVGPEQRRRILPGPEGIRLVALGGAPGAFAASAWTELGGPLPVAP